MKTPLLTEVFRLKESKLHITNDVLGVLEDAFAAWKEADPGAYADAADIRDKIIDAMEGAKSYEFDVDLDPKTVTMLYKVIVGLGKQGKLTHVKEKDFQMTLDALIIAIPPAARGSLK